MNDVALRSSGLARLGLVDDADLDLAEAALLIAAADHPDAALDTARARLTGLVLRLQREAAWIDSVAVRARLLAELVAQDAEITGDAGDYDNPANADFLMLLDRKLGLPVTLSILYVALARRVGWAADPIGLPGHVVVRIGTEPVTQLIDPFDGGRLLGPRGLAGVLARIVGAGGVEAEHLVPLSNRATLVRLVTNQATRARRAGDVARALTLHERMTLIAPGFTALWWERARLEQLAGDNAAARASLGAMLETTRDPGVRQRVRAALNALARTG
ncbi:MAG: transglutaminase family protein [Sphingomonadaceae bacterium]|nr:transglutaminase family protein [Sphingomonadaceae bacterium]